MCVSNHFIEQQAYEYSDEIRKHSLYKFVGTETSSIHFKNDGAGGNFITKVILEDKDGTLYFIDPNPNGLKFAKQEITYREYQKLQNRETRNAFGTFFVILGFFSAVMITLMRFFT